MKQIKVGLIGYGSSGAVYHAPVIDRIDGLLLTKVVSSNLVKVKKQWPHVEVIDQPRELFHSSDIDLVIITSPNTTHYSLAREALEAGKHVVLEKPFVNHCEEGEHLIQLAKDNKRLLSVFHNRRWDADFLTVQKLITSGILGDIHTYESRIEQYRPQVSNQWRDLALEGSGILYDLGSHLVDQAFVLFGFPKTVCADLGYQRPSSATVDYFHLLLGYDKVKVILHANLMNNQPGPRFQIHGTKGSYIKYGLDPQGDMLRLGMKPGDPRWGKELPEFHGKLVTQVNGLPLTGTIESAHGCYEAYYQGIVDALQHQPPSTAPVTAEDALLTIRIIEAAMRSSTEACVSYM